MNTALKNKKVLFICPRHYDFPELIVKQLQSFGASVHYYRDLENQLYFRIAKKLKIHMLILSLENKRIQRLNKTNLFDYLFVIKGNILTKENILLLKQNNPGIIAIMYQWDSLHNFNYNHLIDSFDKVFCFDYLDSASNIKLVYLPLFFTDDYDGSLIRFEDRNIDLLSYGVYYEERYKLIMKIQEFSDNNKLISYLKLYIPPLTFIKLILKGRRFSFKNISLVTIKRPDIAKKLLNSKCVVDIHHSGQTGLTSRTIEALGANCKLLTTNQNIMQEQFFNTDVIQVFQNDNFSQYLNFIKSKYNPIPFSAFSLSSFLLKIFNNVKK